MRHEKIPVWTFSNCQEVRSAPAVPNRLDVHRRATTGHFARLKDSSSQARRSRHQCLELRPTHGWSCRLQRVAFSEEERCMAKKKPGPMALGIFSHL